MPTPLAQDIKAVDENLKSGQADMDSLYDRAVKVFLANKTVLARIMHGCVPEYQGCTLEEIASKYIEGEPQVGIVGVHADDTNRYVSVKIEGSKNEDSTLTEGTVRYDIRYNALAPDNEGLISLIINVEAQTKYTPGYPLIKRAIYYCARMISAQHGPVFKKSEYGRIKKVYSIWICSKPPEGNENTITRYSIEKQSVVGRATEDERNYDLMTAIMICLGNPETAERGGLLRYLEYVLSTKLGATEKKCVLESEFGEAMTQKMESEVQYMCNLSQGVRMEAYEEKDISYAKKMIMRGEPVDKIMDYTEFPLEKLQEIAAKLGKSLVMN